MLTLRHSAPLRGAQRSLGAEGGPSLEASKDTGPQSCNPRNGIQPVTGRSLEMGSDPLSHGTARGETAELLIGRKCEMINVYFYTATSEQLVTAATERGVPSPGAPGTLRTHGKQFGLRALASTAGSQLICPCPSDRECFPSHRVGRGGSGQAAVPGRSPRSLAGAAPQSLLARPPPGRSGHQQLPRGGGAQHPPSGSF